MEVDQVSEGDESVRSEDDLYVEESAFGIWVSWFDAEDAELSQSSNKFPSRITVFRSAVADYLERESLGSGVRAVDFGTSVYIEIGVGDQTSDLLGWVRGLRGYLLDGDWSTFAVIAYGGCWLAARGVAWSDRVGSVSVLGSMGPSEPFRKVMAADVLSHDDDESGRVGWGAGLFVDVEAMDALGRKLRNAPTPLYARDACFFRLSA